MLASPKREFDEAKIRNRLEDLFGDVDAGNRTSLAAALATALMTDAIAAGRSPADIVELDNEAILEAATYLRHGLTSGDFRFVLPFGTRVAIAEPGGVQIAGDILVLDAARPGLHPLQATRRDAHGPNLDLLRKLVRRKSRRLACARIGLPTARTIVDTDERTLLQFPPFAEAGGIVLQRRTHDSGAPRFCSATTQQIDELATSIVEDMKTLWKRRVELGRHVETVRRTAEVAILQECGSDAGIKVANIAIDLSAQYHDGERCVYIEYDALDEMLRRGTVIDYLPTGRDLDVWRFTITPRIAKRRCAELAELQSLGACGRIDHMAAGILTVAPAGAAAVLLELAERHDAFVTIPTPAGPFYATLFWRDGTIQAEADCRLRLDYASAKLVVRGIQLPETVTDNLVGRAVSEVVELPFPCDCTIANYQAEHGTLALELDIGTSLVNCKKQRIWPETGNPSRHDTGSSALLHADLP